MKIPKIPGLSDAGRVARSGVFSGDLSSEGCAGNPGAEHPHDDDGVAGSLGAQPYRPPRQRSQWQAFYKTGFWLRRRRLQLLHEPLCCMCAERGLVVRATVVDHLVPHNGDWNAFRTGALQSLCVVCHNRTKQNIERRGFTSDVGVDGWPTDPRHPANDPRHPANES